MGLILHILRATMEIDSIALSKTLHYTIDNFIKKIKEELELDSLDIKKVGSEIIKRSEYIIRDLRSFALYAYATHNSTDAPSIREYLDNKVENLIQNLLHQDFLEFALRSEEYINISDSELHNFLHTGAMKDVIDLTPSPLELSGLFNLELPQHTSAESEFTNSHDKSSKINCLLSSSNFKSSQIQIDEELSDMRRILEKGFSLTDLDAYNIATILKYENDAVIQQDKNINTDNACQHTTEQQLQSILATEWDADFFADIESEEADNFLSWEGCLRNFLPHHSYISELTPTESLVNLSEKESQAYYSLVNPSDAVCEADMVHDILDLLIGIPSNTFYYDIHSRKFKVKSFVHLPYLSSTCTAKVVANFIESGSIYYLLQKFASDFLHSSKGLVFKGLQEGVKQILTLYKEYIVAVKASSPTMLFLKSDVIENAQLLQTFGTICGINSEKMNFNEIPKGLGLLTYLHDVARSHNGKGNGIMIAVLLKYAYTPYFNYLNKWMTEGICDDPFEEFQIMEDFNYLVRRDAMYWKFAYTENIDDSTRAVPPEIKKYSQDILDCGKSIGLLKLCCPELFGLKFLFWKSPPSLSMTYSFSAAVNKFQESAEYITLKEKAEEMYNQVSGISDDKFFIECQKFINEDIVLKHIQRKWDILLSAFNNNSNILTARQIKRNVNSEVSFNIQTNFCNSAKKWHSLNSLVPCSSTIQDRELCFSGKLHRNVGLLFSSCGYIESNTKSYNLLENFDDFSTLDFCKQLDLMSYTQRNSYNPLITMDSRYEELSKFEFLNAVKEDGKISKMDFCWTINNESDALNMEKNFCNYDLSKPFQGEILNINTNDKKISNSFLEKLSALLVSEYGDSVNDIYSYIQVTSLQRLMMHNFNTVLKMRTHFVEKTIMKYIVKELGLDTLFSTLRDIFFLQHESFSQSLCEQLFILVMKCKTPAKFANWAVLNEIFLNAVSGSELENNPFLSSVNVNVSVIPDEMPAECNDILRMFFIEFEVKWPLNIIIHQTCIRQYLKIFSTLLEIEFLCWFVGHVWRKLIISSKELNLDDSPQFRKIMLKRFDIDQFIRVIRNSIHQHLQGPLWEFLQKNLSIEESSIDTLENIHMQYLEKALARCFLTEETHVLHELTSVMFRQIYRFCKAIFECRWSKNDRTGHYETLVFKELSYTFDTFKKYQKVFLSLWLQNEFVSERNTEGDIDEKIWTILGQRVSGFLGNNYRNRKKY